MNSIERKLQIQYKEKFVETQYNNDEVSCVYFFKNPTQGPFIIIPSIENLEVEVKYSLSIYSNHQVNLDRLDNNKNAVIISHWDAETTGGGCHLYDKKWEKNTDM